MVHDVRGKIWESVKASPRHDLELRSPTFLARGTSFVEESFSTDGGWGGDGFRMIQVHYIYCALYFYYYYIVI